MDQEKRENKRGKGQRKYVRERDREGKNWNQVQNKEKDRKKVGFFLMKPSTSKKQGLVTRKRDKNMRNRQEYSSSLP